MRLKLSGTCLSSSIQNFRPAEHVCLHLPCCSEDIRNQLPQEAKRFDTIDKAWLKIMTDTAKNTNVLEACSTEGRCASSAAAAVWQPA